jgi:DNA repair protein RadC
MVTLNAFERSPRLSEIKVSYRSRTNHAERKAIRVPIDAVEYLREVWDKDTLEFTEYFLIICLNADHQAVGWVKVSSGGFSAALVDPRVVFAIALQTASSAVILSHNHPSGSCEPSPEDIRLTKRLKEAGDLLGIRVLGHIILTRDGALSFDERGLL